MSMRGSESGLTVAHTIKGGPGKSLMLWSPGSSGHRCQVDFSLGSLSEVRPLIQSAAVSQREGPESKEDFTCDAEC